MGWYGSSTGLNSIRVFIGPAAAGTSGVIDWGDGLTDPLTDGGNQEIHHTYAAPGTYTMTVTDAAGTASSQTVKVTGTRAALDDVAPLAAVIGGPDLQVTYTGLWNAARKVIWDSTEVPVTSAVDPASNIAITVQPSLETAARTVWTAIEDADGSRTEPYPFTFTATTARKKK